MINVKQNTIEYGFDKPISYEELLEFLSIEEDEFVAFPVWVELNPRYNEDVSDRFRAVVLKGGDHPNTGWDDVYTTNGNFEASTYNKRWRFWYACGYSRPSNEICSKNEWERFEWDKKP